MQNPLHHWNLSIPEAILMQKKLADQIVFKNIKSPINLIAGLDCAIDTKNNLCVAACILWDKQQNQIIEQHFAKLPLTFPYVPGLLSFREIPTLLKAYQQLQQQPDVIMLDGQGIAHPRRLGIASHFGLWVEKPTLGCGKSKLCGHYEMPGEMRGDVSSLIDKGEEIGKVVRTKNKVKPLFISPGHLCDLPTAVQLVLECGRGYRLPEPTRLADMWAGKIKKI